MVVRAHATQNHPRVPFQPSSIEPLSTLTMPVGTRSRITSSGHTHRTQVTSSLRRRRGRPGCTRYQWPSSMASVTAPRKAAPVRVRATASASLPPAARPAATRPTTPMTGAIRSRRGSNSRPAGVVDHGDACARCRSSRRPARVRRSCSARWPGTPAPLRATETPRATSAATATPSDADLADDDGVEQHPAGERAGGEGGEDAAQQPAVAEADLAVAGGDPQEGEPAGGPLQEHRGGVEVDHGERG